MSLFSSPRCRCQPASSSDLPVANTGGKIILVGNPNVGKSVLFNSLTGQYATVSNYPGTTVEVTRGRARIGGGEFEVVDTPGMYSLIPISEEERVARNILLLEKASVILHVIDAKNISRMLSFTFQLVETGLPVMLVMNLMDELRRTGSRINIELLENELQIPVTGVVALTGEGIDILKGRIEAYVRSSRS